MARWRRREDGPLIPDWVRVAWVLGTEEERARAGAWLDGLEERDPERWYEAFVEMISTPGYTTAGEY